MTGGSGAPGTAGAAGTARSSATYLSAAILLRLANAGASAAIPILALQRLDSVAVGGVLVGIALAPSIIAAPVIGAVLDSARHPRLLIAASGLLTAAALAVASGLGPIPAWVVGLVLAVSGVATPFYFGGLSSFVTSAFATDARAYASDMLAYNVGSVVGPLAVAVAAAAGSTGAALLVLSGLAVVGSVACLALPFHPHGGPAHTGLGPLLRRIGEGLRYLFTHRPLAVVTVSSAITQFGQGAIPVVSVAIAVQRDGSEAHAAWVVTAFAVGGLLGSLAAIAWPLERIPPEWRMGISFVATGAATLAAAVDLDIVWTAILLGVSALFTAHGAAALFVLRTEQSPKRLRAQVFTVGSGLRATTGALGAAIAGFLAGVPASGQLLLVAAVWIVSALLLLAFPRGTRPLASVA